MLGGPTRTYAWIPDRGATGFDGAEEFRRAHLWIERLGRSMDRVVIVASRVDLGAVAPMDPVELGYQVATRRVHVAARHPTAVVALWPTGDLLERAERQAEGGALCVVSARPDDVSGWLARSNPTDLSVLDGRPAIELHPEVRAVLDDLVHLGGHEQLADATSRAAIVRRLRELVAHGHEPPADAVETYAASTGLVNDRGARRIRGIYEAVLVGEPFRIHGHLV